MNLHTRIAIRRKAVKAVSWSALRRTGESRNPDEPTISATKLLFLTLNCECAKERKAAINCPIAAHYFD